MKRALGLIAITAITATAGCASTTSSPAGPVPNPAASASLASQAAAQRSAQAAVSSAEASASSQICTTHACIAGDLQQGLTGLVAEDEAVTTRVVCRKSTVRFHRAADAYSAACTVTYSDGSVSTGTGNLLISAKKVTFQPAGT